MQRRYQSHHTKTYGTSKKSSSTLRALILSWFLIGAGLIYLFWGGNDTPTVVEDTQQASGSLAGKHVIGEKIISSGLLTAVEHFSLYTHTFISDKGETYGAKSTVLELYNYSGSVQIKGEIVDFKDELPIIRIDELIPARTEGAPLGETSFTYFPARGLGIDLAASNGFGVKQEGDAIILFDKEKNNETLLNISPFVCSAQDPIKDCVTLKRNFIQYGNDSFVASQGNTLYNLGEANTWLTFANDTWGYYITPKSQQALLDFSHVLVFLTEDSIKEQAKAQALSLCRTIDQSMQTITTVGLTYPQAGIAQIALVGNNTEGKQVSCSLEARLGSSVQWRFLSFTPVDAAPVQQQVLTAAVEQKEIIDALQDNGTGANVPPQPSLPISIPTLPAPASTSGRLTYASVRGYTMYFSSPKISRAGEILSDGPDLGISGLRCRYKINLTQRAHADQIETSPDATIYECVGTISASAAQAHNLSTIGTAASGQVFYMQYYTPVLQDVQVVVQ